MSLGVAGLARLGVRARTTLAATAVVGLVLAGSGVLLVAATRTALLQSVETTVSARAVDLASQVDAGATPRPVPLIRGISVQVVVDGAVVSSTEDIEGQRPMVDSEASSGAVTTVRIPSLDHAEHAGEGEDGDEGPFLVAIAQAGVEGDRTAVLAAASLVAVENATATLIPLLAIGIPAIALLAGLTVHRLTRRAFRPVEAMARQADVISYSDLDLRIPESEPDDEIRGLAVVLNRMLDRLETSVMRQRRFTADAGHELKSPVSTLLTMAEVAEANPGGFTVTELASDVAQQSRRLARLVDDLLLVARSDERGLDLELEWFDLAPLIAEELATRAVQPVEYIAEGVASVVMCADRRRIGQVIRNLLDNGARHAAGVVRIETRLTGSEVVVVVGDDGPGVPEDDRERVFERFVRLDEARSRGAGGTGLGLSVVKSIVDAHGGRVEVGGDPALGGAAFSVSLPLGRGRGAAAPT